MWLSRFRARSIEGKIVSEGIAQVIDGMGNPIPSLVSVVFGYLTLFHADSFLITVFHYPSNTGLTTGVFHH